MLKKIKSLTYQYAIPAAFIVFVVLDCLLLGLGRLLSLLPPTLPMAYLAEIILILVPAAFVCVFGFSSAFKKGKFFRGLLYGLPVILSQLVALVIFFSKNLGNPEASWRPWYMIVYGMFCVLGIGLREEFFYRATIQNILAKKYANSVKGIWITLIISAVIFGLTHASNIFFGTDPLAVLMQVLSATFVGLLFGAIYLRSGNIWVLVLIHTLIDTAGLAASTFLRISETENINQLAQLFTWGKLAVWLIYIGLTIFLLRPSKCKQIRESLCFADEESEAATRT